jgi:hypothetical protein
MILTNSNDKNISKIKLELKRLFKKQYILL